MSRIIEGSLEILRPISVGAVNEEQEWDDASRTLPSEQDDDDQNDTKHAFQKQQNDKEEEEEPRINYDRDEQENGDGSDDDESSMETDESSGSEDEEDESLIAEEGRERATPITRNDAKWRSKLELLRNYRQYHGRCRVPQRYEIDGVKLGFWVSTQKKEYRKHREGKPSWITQERIDQLKAVGLDFNDTRRKRNEAQWQSKLELLRNYQQHHGHCRVPRLYEIDGVKLGYWLNAQRTEYSKHREGKPSWITQEHIDQLKAVGLDFNDTQQKRDEAQWQSKLELLRKYQDRNGHCLVPRTYEMDGVKLGKWVAKQKVAYKKHSEGKPSQITQEHIEQLETVGIEWNPQETKWQSNFELLQNYQQLYGHCRVPQSYEIDGVKLGKWVMKQRNKYKKQSKSKNAKITIERINALNAIGFELFPGKLKKSQEDKLSSDESSSEDEMMPEKTLLSSKRTRGPSTDRRSSSMAHTISAKSPRLKRQQPSQQKSRRLNDGSRVSIIPELISVFANERSDDEAPLQEKRSSLVADCFARQRVASESIQATNDHCSSKRRIAPNQRQSANNAAIDSVPTTNRLWDEYFDRLVEFKWNNGHCRVPVGFCVDGCYNLGQWVVVQRLQHNRLLDGRPSSITAEQVERLNSIVFVWKVR